MATECIWLVECSTGVRVHMVFGGKAHNKVALLQIYVRVGLGRVVGLLCVVGCSSPWVETKCRN